MSFDQSIDFGERVCELMMLTDQTGTTMRYHAQNIPFIVMTLSKYVFTGTLRKGLVFPPLLDTEEGWIHDLI